MKVKIKKIHENAVIPKQATEFAGGWDLVVTEIVKESDNSVVCKLGFALQPPNNYRVVFVPRSSITKTNWFISNAPTLGDPDYLGEYLIRYKCVPTKINSNYHMGPFNIPTNKLLYDKFPYNVGDRVAQMYLEEIIPIEWEIVEELIPTIRGEGGFGSTGNAQIPDSKL